MKRTLSSREMAFLSLTMTKSALDAFFAGGSCAAIRRRTSCSVTPSRAATLRILSSSGASTTITLSSALSRPLS